MTGLLTVRIIADGEDALRLHKRIGCAARALGIALSIESQHSDDGIPRILIDESIQMEGLPRTEDIEQRLAAWFVASHAT